MRHSYAFILQLLLMMGCLAAIPGCTPLTDAMPTPPGFLSGVELKGPYDADIPVNKVNQIKTAGLTADWAVPYIFLSVASRFESDGDDRRSLAFYERAIGEFRKRNNLQGEATAWCRKMSALQRFGDGAAALKAISEMEKRTSGGIPDAFVFYSLGHYHFENGDYARALEHLGRALESNSGFAGKSDLTALRRDTELEYGMALVLADYFPAVSGRLLTSEFDETFYRDIRRPVLLSLSHLERARSLNTELIRAAVTRYFPEIIPPYQECDIQNYLGLALGIQGDSAKAFRHLEQAGAIARQVGYHLGKADGVFFLNQVYLLNKNMAEGKQAAYHLENIGEQYRILPYVVWSKLLLAHYSRLSGDIDTALKLIHDFFVLTEKNKDWLHQVSDFRGTGRFKLLSVRDVMFDLFIQKGDFSNAFKTAEEIKATPFVKSFKEVVWEGLSAEGQMLARVRAFHAQAVDLYKKLVSPVNASAVFLKTVQSAERVQKDLSNTLSVMKHRHGGLYGLMYLDLPDARDIQRGLDQNTTLFSYYSTAQTLYVWGISRRGLHMEKINRSVADIESFLAGYHKALLSKDRNEIDALSEKAYDAFLKPVIPYVNGDRIVLVLHGPLSGFPFAGMRYMKSYLKDVFSIVYLPHIKQFHQPAFKTATGGSKRVLYIAGSTTVRNASAGKREAELETLKRIDPKMDVVLSSGNSGNDILRQTGEVDMIYYAAECYLADDLPWSSGLLLSADAKKGGYLATSDLFRLSVKSRVSVVGSCLRGRAPLSSGEGLAALTESLLYASSAAVVMPLWPIDEKPRTAFLDAFMTHLAGTDDVADALKAAQNDMMTVGFGPAEWAAFIMVGRY